MYITLGFSKPNKFKVFSEIIKLVDKSPFSHAYVKIEAVSLNRTLVYQASHGAVHFLSNDIFIKKNTITNEYIIKVSNEIKTKILQFCVDNAGKPYSTLGVINIGLKRLFNFPLLINDGNNSFWCSELVAQILNIIEDKQLNPNITPKELFDYLEKKYGKS